MHIGLYVQPGRRQEFDLRGGINFNLSLLRRAVARYRICPGSQGEQKQKKFMQTDFYRATLC